MKYMIKTCVIYKHIQKKQSFTTFRVPLVREVESEIETKNCFNSYYLVIPASIPRLSEAVSTL